jgi:hypothetical protein
VSVGGEEAQPVVVLLRRLTNVILILLNLRRILLCTGNERPTEPICVCANLQRKQLPELLQVLDDLASMVTLERLSRRHTGQKQVINTHA